MVRESLRTKRIGLVLRLGLAGACLAYGVYLVDPRALRISGFGLALYALPLLFQLSRSALVRAYALWFGVFLVAQVLLAPILLGDTADLYHHVPNLTHIVNPEVTEFTGGGDAREQRVTTDELGFRASPQVNYRRPTDVRIFAIGGSTTEEFAINDEQTWTHNVQQALSQALSLHVEVVNTGTSGAMSQHHIATLKYIRTLYPNVAIFLIGANDWNFDIQQEFGSNIMPERTYFDGTPLGRLARWYYYRVFGLVVHDVTRADFIPLGHSLERERKVSWFPEKSSDRYLANLATLGNICRANRLTCMFITQPTGYQPNATDELKSMFWMTPPAASYTLTFESLVHVAEVYNRALINFANQNNFAVCDVVPKIEPTAENFTDEMHFRFKGSVRVAEAVSECLKPLLAKTTSSQLR